MSRISERKIVLIYRETRLDELIARHNTREQVRFYLESREQSFAEFDDEDCRMKAAIKKIAAKLAEFGRVQILERTFLPNFLFGPDDIPVVIGQDGLVANTLKYLSGQPVVAINPLPDLFDGKLLPFNLREGALTVRKLINQSECPVLNITMAEAHLADGQSLLAVNDFYIGPRLPVSARYTIEFNGQAEQQSSSGIIVSTGLGATGWMSSLMAGAEGITGHRAAELNLQWHDPVLIFGVREPFRSQATSADIIFGKITENTPLSLSSHIPEGGVIFSDGMVQDSIEFNAGCKVSIGVSSVTGQLVMAG